MITHPDYLLCTDISCGAVSVLTLVDTGRIWLARFVPHPPVPGPLQLETVSQAAVNPQVLVEQKSGTQLSFVVTDHLSFPW